MMAYLSNCINRKATARQYGAAQLYVKARPLAIGDETANKMSSLWGRELNGKKTESAERSVAKYRGKPPRQESSYASRSRPRRARPTCLEDTLLSTRTWTHRGATDGATTSREVVLSATTMLPSKEPATPGAAEKRTGRIRRWKPPRCGESTATV